MRLPLRSWLIVGFVVAILTTGVASSLVGAWLIDEQVSSQALDKARLDLNSARLVYRGALGEVRDGLRLLSHELREAVARSGPELAAELARARRRERLDFLDLVDGSGRVLCRGQNGGRGDLLQSPLLAELRPGRDLVASSLVLDEAALRRESPALAARARIARMPLPGLEREGRAEERSGLVIAAAARVPGRAEVLHGGVLLNRDQRIVDTIRDTIYQGESFRGQEVGEGTICLGDLRVATNARLESGGRAIGTVVDPAVRQRVLVEGSPRVDRALVINDRHFTAYEPIRDLSGKVIGILSLGIPEQKFAEARRRALLVFFGIAIAGVALAALLSGLVARRWTRRIRELADAVGDLASGNLERRVEPDASITEVGALGEGVNALAAAIRERDLQLLHRTQEQIGKAERLAMIGRLAAGVAHEINNPLGGIMLFSSLLLRKAAPDAPQRPNLERIAGEAKRCQRIVQGLLDFARHREPTLEEQEVQPLIEKTLQLVSGQALFHNVQTVRDYATALPAVRIDAGQLQQVLVNLLVNAVEAMDGRGTLTLRTRAAERGVQIDVSDTGCGIAPENLEHLFEPFFTTKEVGHGTGLGLSISRGIVENHGGAIWAESAPGCGTTFSIRLPAGGPA